MMKKSTKCTALLGSLVLLSAGVNAIFIATDGGRSIEQAQQVERQTPAPPLTGRTHGCTDQRCDVKF